MKGFYKAVFGVLFVLMFLPASSTHIVGGVMNYRYLGSDNFEINLSVYRDCKRGIPPLDPYALIWVWNHDIPDTLLTTFFLIPFDSVLDATIKDPCALIQPDECVNWTRYTGTLNLPPNNTGYTVYYQRCCRNNSILNITRSPFSGEIEWGATYSVFIPAGVNGEHIPNSTPVYTNYPPVYICEGKPIDYDHSATDADGDQLRYRLCTPVTGASIWDPTNYYTLEPPPFDTIVWNNPYSLDNILGGVPLSIDPLSGIMSGTPNTLGQFVVGVCVDEFRNNRLLTTTVRDFQFNVVNCGLQVISSFFAPDLQCNSLTVNFDNQSSGADRYYWDFGDGSTSTDINPVHTYADTGYYRVSLVSVKGDTCTASFSRVISIQYKRIEAGFRMNDTACIKAGDPLRFIDLSTDSINVASWQWTFGNGQQSTAQNPVLIYDGIRDTLSATLLVTSVNGCTSTLTKLIRFYRKPSYTLPAVITKCSIQSSPITVTMSGNNTFSWSPATGLDNPNAQSPNTNIQQNTTYYVTIRSVLSNGDTCVQFDSVRVQILNTLQINASDTLSVCQDSVRLGIPVSPGQTVTWSTSNTFSPVIGTSANIVVRQNEAEKKYYVRVDAGGCQAVDSIVVRYNDTLPQITLADNILQCSNQVSLSALIDHSESVVWATQPDFSVILANGPAYSTTQTLKTVKYYVRALFRTCQATDSIVVTVQDTLPVITLDDTLQSCNAVFTINASVRNFSSVIWSTSPTFSPILATGRNITVTQTVPYQTYYIKAFYRDCEKTDSVVVRYQDVSPQISVADSVFICEDFVNITAIVSQAQTVNWSDTRNFSNLLSATSTLQLTQTVPVKTYYIRAKFDACTTLDSVLVRVQTDLPVIVLQDTLFVCGDSVRLSGIVSNYDNVQWAYDAGFTQVFSTLENISIAQTQPWRTYFVRAFKGTCSVSDSIAVGYNDTLPVVEIMRDPLNFCSNPVFGEATASNYTDIAWSADRDFTQLLSDSLKFSADQSDPERLYYFRARYGSCIVVDSITLYQRQLKYAVPDVQVCSGEPVFIDLNVQTASQYDIIWTLADTVVETNNISTIAILPRTSQWVYVDIRNIYGCAVNDSFYIRVDPLPFVDAIAIRDSVYAGETVELLATESQVYTYQWVPAETVSNPAIFNPEAQLEQTTLFTVTVIDTNGCRNSDSVLVKVLTYRCETGSVFIPNAFSPNGDGVNDLFRPRSEILAEYTLIVYDRWGVQVFESTSEQTGWDGLYQGKAAPADAYAYYFKGRCLQGETIIIRGNITLFR